ENFDFGLRPIMKPMYRKPYPEWIDHFYMFLGNYKVFEIVTFSRDGSQSTIEHIGHFTVQCSDVNDFIHLRQFGNSLTSTTFNWYVSLSPNYSLVLMVTIRMNVSCSVLYN
ncbi:hypothetical protein CFOL_v3_26974, partial [Cephalotus follicularis]